jgi:hypothetical protein
MMRIEVVWNYRVLKQKEKDLKEFPEGYSYSIIECYYSQKRKAKCYSVLDDLSKFESVEELKEQINRIQFATTKSLLTLKGQKLKGELE